jgi:hypothetical protein
MGVRLQRGELNNTVDNVIEVLKDHGYDKCFTHGTTGTVLRKLRKSAGEIGSSDTACINHDFHSGICCFKGNLRWDLSFALDRSWPFADGRDNPSIVLFPEELQTDISNSFHVGEDSLDNLAQKSLPEEEYENFRKKTDEWSDENKKWKEFVKLAKTFITVPRKPDVFYGLLHDCDSTLAIDSNWQEPKPDKDKWVQYCFKYNETLGKKRIFIEFMIDWDEWFDDPEAKEKLERARKDGVSNNL